MLGGAGRSRWPARGLTRAVYGANGRSAGLRAVCKSELDAKKLLFGMTEGEGQARA